MVPQETNGSGLASTYFVQDWCNKEKELARLTSQGQLLTNAMGEALPDQPTSGSFHCVLDVDCGMRGWILAAAQEYLGMFVGGRKRHLLKGKTSVWRTGISFLWQPWWRF